MTPFADDGVIYGFDDSGVMAGCDVVERWLIPTIGSAMVMIAQHNCVDDAIIAI